MSVVEFNLATLFEATAERVPDRFALLHKETARTFADLADRARRLARYLSDRELGAHTERSALRGHQAGQDFLAQYLYNGPEFIEGLLGGMRGRLAPFNVNYRYVAEELRYLFADARPAAVQYHGCFAPTLAAVLDGLDLDPVLLQVDDGSGEPLLPGAVDYESALASVPSTVDVEPSPDDLYVLYTGGTTGMPKGVLWRQADAAVSLLRLRNLREGGREWASVQERLGAISRRGHRMLPLAPLIHGAAQFGALQTLCEGSTVVIQDEVRRFDPADALDAIARHGVRAASIVGDAFGRPLADELEARPRELPGWEFLISGGAALSEVHKQRIVAAVPHLTIIESIGASETGVQGRALGVGGTGSGAGPAFAREVTTTVLAEDLSAPLEPGHAGTGWLATAGRVPLGYLGDEAKTARTFPVLDGVRYSVPGDRAKLLADGKVEVYGRESTTINTGGEKVFAEEVEAAVRSHPDVLDAVVCGRPSERWGAEVVALVAARPGAALDAAALAGFCADRLARYKLPKAVLFVDEVRRSPSGKADYRWAAETAAASVSTG